MAAEKKALFILFSEFNKRHSQFEITHIPLDLIYFNLRAMQHSTFSQAWQHGCSTAGSATVSSDNCAVGDGEGSPELPGGTDTTDVPVWSMGGQ